MSLILRGYFRSSAAYRVRIALNLKGLAYAQDPVNLRRGEQKSAAFLAHNAQGLVPSLATPAGELTQSMAIIEWLEETYPEPAFLPGDAHARAQARAFAQIIACDIHPLNNLRVLTCLSETMGADEARLDGWRQRWIIEGFDACAALLAGRDTRFCFGDAPGLADIFLVPQVYSANRFGVDMGRWERLCDIHAACQALPAFADAHPTLQPDCDL